MITIAMTDDDGIDHGDPLVAQIRRNDRLACIEVAPIAWACIIEQDVIPRTNYRRQTLADIKQGEAEAADLRPFGMIQDQRNQ